MVEPSGPPKLELNFNNANSKYNYGGKVAYIDLSFYAPYKPTVDKIILAISYIFFFMAMYKNIPSIINGTSAVTHKIGGK